MIGYESVHQLYKKGMMINFIESFREIYCTKVICTAPFNAAIYDISSRTNGIITTRFFLKPIQIAVTKEPNLSRKHVLENFGENMAISRKSLQVKDLL